jgi:hypothetical protein
MIKRLVLVLAAFCIFCTASNAQREIIPIRPIPRLVRTAVIVTLKLPTTAMDNTPLIQNYSLTSVNLYFSGSSMSCSTIANLCNLKPTITLYSQNNLLPTSYTYAGVPVGATIYVRADVCNVNGCSYLSNELSAVNNKSYNLTIQSTKPIQTFVTNAPPENPEIVITLQPAL